MTDTSIAASGAATSATTTPAASQSAGSSSSAPSTVTTPATPGAASSPAAAEAPQQSVEEFIDAALAAAVKPDTGAEPDTAEAPKEPTADTEPVDDEAKAAAAEQEGQEEQPEPDHYKGIFKRHPELRAAYFKVKEYDKHLTIKEARQYRETFPTWEDARQSAEDGAALLQLTQDYERDAASILPILEGNPASFERLQSAVVERVAKDPAKAYKANPEAFRPLLEYAAELFIGNLRAEGDPEAAAVAEFLAERQGIREKAEAQQEKAGDPNTEAELKTLRTEKKAAIRERAVTLIQGVTADSDRLLSEQIAGEIGRRDPNKVMPEAARARIVKESLAAIRAALKAQPLYRAGLSAVLRGGGDVRQAAVDHIAKYAKVSLPKVVAEGVAKWREEHLAANQAAVERAEKSAPPAATATPAVPPQKRPMSYDEERDAILAKHGFRM